MIAIIDYGMGNIHSVRKALEILGGDTVVTNKPKDIQAAQKLVLPGVGAFEDAISELKRQGLVSPIKEGLKKRKPFLGICLGLQLLFTESQEAKETKGLGILNGAVKRFSPSKGFKVPHMGWNALEIKNKDCPLLKGVVDKSYVYFCHSYYPQPDKQDAVAAGCEYISDFAALVWQDNVYGVQFHPEKSQETGLRMLKNFVELC